ncbi:MAG: TM2 domain-containing protein [Clostridia bacterium]|nr:TM2 domain-containing protein [Clostridia bacterium]
MSNNSDYIAKIRKHIPKEAYRELCIKLDAVSEKKCNKIKELKLKNIYATVILSLFLGIFGADRFYAGDIRLGIGKLALGIIGYLLGGFGTVGFAIQLLSYVWWIEDIFFSYRLSRKRNAEKIYYILNEN